MRTSISTSISDIDPAAWDALNPGGVPFLRHAFLAGLEASRCVGPGTGWTPAPVTLSDEHGLAAAVPAYVKSHSFGEFVFDFSWAHAYAQNGLEYYPKLVIGVPFTPATSPRLLVRPDLDAARVRAELVEAVQQFATSRGFSSIHALFPDEQDRAAFGAAGWLTRSDVQFHWHNRGYRDYDHFLEGFTTKFRKNARRERRRIVEAGIQCETLLGPDIDTAAAEEICDLHRITFHRHGHESYLNREFFRLLPTALGEQLMVKRARLDGRVIAASVFYWNRDALYGRYWGAREHHDGLHFELCYHQGIDFCIERGIGRFEPGTGGEHKISRGFAPAHTWSMHWIVDPRFREAIADYLEREGRQVEGFADEVERHVPYRDQRRTARSR